MTGFEAVAVSNFCVLPVLIYPRKRLKERLFISSTRWYRFLLPVGRLDEHRRVLQTAAPLYFDGETYTIRKYATAFRWSQQLNPEPHCNVNQKRKWKMSSKCTCQMRCLDAPVFKTLMGSPTATKLSE
jgi:hypothetical protein